MNSNPRRTDPHPWELEIRAEFHPQADVTLFCGDCRELLDMLPDESVQLFVTSPPYNIGKRYEVRRSLDEYLSEQADVIRRCVAKLSPAGSICWQVGNHVDDREVYPLDILLYPFFKECGLKLRNRIVWHFEHGLHCSRRFSGRHETILWFTRSDEYTFHLDPVRVPQKYPGKKSFKGPRIGQYTCHPLGKNPSDVWVFPNVKHNHVEKTLHPCQFPVELVERLVLSLTDPGQLVVDPYMGVASAAVAAIRHGCRFAGSDLVEEYVRIGRQRVEAEARGELRTRPIERSVYVPPQSSPLVRREPRSTATSDRIAAGNENGGGAQLRLLDRRSPLRARKRT